MPQNGSVGMSAGGLGGSRERSTGPLMRVATDYAPDQANNVYTGYPYPVSFRFRSSLSKH